MAIQFIGSISKTKTRLSRSDLRVYENIISKVITVLPNFESILIIDEVPITDKQLLYAKSSDSKEENCAKKKTSKKLARVRAGRKENRDLKEENEPKIISQRQSWTRRTIKPIAKI